jgi:hypothetical protein
VAGAKDRCKDRESSLSASQLRLDARRLYLIHSGRGRCKAGVKATYQRSPASKLASEQRSESEVKWQGFIKIQLINLQDEEFSQWPRMRLND